MKKNIIVAVILFVLFFLWTFLMKNNCFIKLDQNVYTFVSGFISETNTFIMKCFTFFGSSAFILLASFIIIIMCKDFRKVFICSLIVEIGLSEVGKLIIGRARPNILPLVIEKTFSYPSGHALIGTFFFGIMIYFIYKSNMKDSKKSILISLLITLLFFVCLSRIYLGVHYFSDIIGGILLGTGYIILCLTLYQSNLNKVKEKNIIS